MSRFFVREREKWEERYADPCLLDDVPATATSYEGAVVLPLVEKRADECRAPILDVAYKGGVCDRDFNFVAGHARSVDNPDANLSCEGSYTVGEQDIDVRDEVVVFGGVLYYHFGHALTDGMSRLWYLPGHPDFEKVVFVRCPFEFVGYYDPFELISLMGVSLDRVEIIEKPTRFAKVIVPDEALLPLGGYRREFIVPFDAIRSNVKPADIKKIYLTRREFQASEPDHDDKRTLLNEGYYESFFARRGFSVVAPETLPVAEQIALIAGAEEIVSTLGTMTHMLLFADPGVTATILNRAEGVIMAQLLVDKARGVQSYYVEVTRNPLPVQHSRGPFLLAPTTYFKDYLDAVGLDYDDAELDAGPMMPELILRFLELWAEKYRQTENCPFIAYETMFDVVRRMNETLFNDTFDEDAYRGADALRVRFQKSVAREKGLREKLKGLRAERKQLKGDLKAVRKENRRLDKENQRLSKELAGIKNSKSWKLTAPLRKLRRG